MFLSYYISAFKPDGESFFYFLLFHRFHKKIFYPHPERMKRKIKITAPDNPTFRIQGTEMFCRIQPGHTWQCKKHHCRYCFSYPPKKLFLILIDFNQWKNFLFCTVIPDIFRTFLPFLFLVLLTFRAAAADTLLILGDSLSAGYRMSASAAWPALLNDKWQSKTSVVNASISGDTSQQGLARLPALLKQHQPRWVLVELGGNDGLRGFQPQQTEQTLRQILQDVKAANAEPLLMQIRLPANYGRRYNEAFSAIYPKLAKEFDVPLLPFFMEEVYLKPQWMQDDGIHPNRDAQPFIADWMAKQLQPLVNHDS
mgnify:CR=1 FL=1